MGKIKLTQTELAQLIENVVNDTLSAKKKEWLAEQRQKETKIIEEKVKAVITNLSKTK